MRLLVLLSTFLTAAIAAKLPTFAYSPPSAQHHQAEVGATQGFAHTGTSELEPNRGHAGQNGLSQTYDAPNGPQDLIQFTGHAGQNGLTQTYTEPQDLTQSNGYSGQNGLTQAYSEYAGPQDLTQTNGNAGQNDLTQTYDARDGSQDLIQSNGHVEQNGLTQTISGLVGPQVLTQTNGYAGQNDLSQIYGAPATPQDLTQSNGHAVTGVFIPAFEEPVGFHAQTQQQGPTEQDTSFETYEGSTGSHGQAQGPSGQDTLDGPAGSHGPEEAHVATRPVLGGGNGCLEGQVRHADGSCVTPEVTRSVYVFGVPETPRPSTLPSPRLPPPRVHEHVLLIRAPERWTAPQPLVVPPPAQKSVVYVLRKDSQDEEPRVIEAPVTPPTHPEVFFVNYKDGDNLSLPNGLDLQQALQGAITGPVTQLDAAAEGDAAVDARVWDFSGPGEDLSLEGRSEDLLVGYSDDGFTSGDHRDGTFVFEGHSDDDLSLEGQSDGTIVVLEQREDDVLEDHSDEDSLAGHSNGGLVLESNRNGGLVLGGHSDEDFVLRGHDYDGLAGGFQSDEDLVLRDHSEDGLELSGHSVDGFVAGSHGNTAFSVLRDESPEYHFSGVRDSLVEAPASQKVSDSSAFGGGSRQEGGDSGHTVPAQLLSVSFDGSAGSFSDFTSSGKETAVRGVEDTTVSDRQAAVSGGVSYGPPSSPTTGPAQFYASP